MTDVQPAPLRAAVAEEVRVWMARRKMSGVRLAVAIGRTQPYLSRRLTGEVALDLDDLQRIAAALAVPVVQLLPRDQQGVGTGQFRPPAGVKTPVSRSPLVGRPAGPPRPPARAGAATRRPSDRRPAGHPGHYRLDAA